MGNTDAHNPVFYGRPVTLIFAKEKTPPSMKEALFSKRTAVLGGSTLYGKDTFLSALFFESVSVKNSSITISA